MGYAMYEIVLDAVPFPPQGLAAPQLGENNFPPSELQTCVPLDQVYVVSENAFTAVEPQLALTQVFAPSPEGEAISHEFLDSPRSPTQILNRSNAEAGSDSVKDAVLAVFSAL